MFAAIVQQFDPKIMRRLWSVDYDWTVSRIMFVFTFVVNQGRCLKLHESPYRILNWTLNFMGNFLVYNVKLNSDTCSAAPGPRSRKKSDTFYEKDKRVRNHMFRGSTFLINIAYVTLHTASPFLENQPKRDSFLSKLIVYTEYRN